MSKEYQPKTGQRCSCKRGIQRDNCPACEGTGWLIDFKAIRERNNPQPCSPELGDALSRAMQHEYKVRFGGAR